MGSFCSSPTTVNQSQTYSPNPQAMGAMSGALNQAQGVAQTPFQTPVAPVAGFSGQQNQAFNLANSIPGAAQPFINEGANFLSGQNVGNFYNPFAANVFANLHDTFGQQMSDTTGKLQNAAGGVGADRIAVGQSELAKQQGLVAGQTAANLWQPALAASQNAGYGFGNLGQLNQASQMQGMNALLTSGGLQQQLQQAQMNAPYQNELARIQWPYQNSQFLTGATAALAPGMGGTTSGQTTYPQQSPWGTVAGLGMAGAGVYGLGNQQGWWGGDVNDTGGGSGSGGGSARGGRIGYAEGGAVDDNMYGNSGISDDPIDVSGQSLIPQSQFTPIQPHIPQLQAPQQQQGGGGGFGDIIKTAATILPFILSTGGRAGNPYARGGRAYADGGMAPTGMPQQIPGAQQMGAMAQNPAAAMYGLPALFGGMMRGQMSPVSAMGGTQPQMPGGNQGGQPQMSLDAARGMLGMFGGPQMASAFGGQGGQPQMGMPGAFGGGGWPQGMPQSWHQGSGPQSWHRGNPQHGPHQWNHADGGRVGNPYGYADGGAVDEPPWQEGLRRLREASDVTRLAPPMMDFTTALMALRPSGVRLYPSMNSQGLPTGNQRMQIRGRFQRAGTDVNHAGTEWAHMIGGVNAGNQLGKMLEDPLGYHAEQRARREIPEDSSPMIERPLPEPADAMAGREQPIELPASFEDRWGALGGPGQRAELPPEEPANPFAAAPERIPLPRPKPRNLPPRAMRRPLSLDASDYQEPLYFRHAQGFQEGGEVEYDSAEGFEPPLFLQSGLEEMPPTPSPMRSPPMRSSREAKPLGAPRGAALASDLESLRYIRDNPGAILSAAPSPVANVIGAAIENQGQRGPQQMGFPRARPEKSIFDMAANAEPVFQWSDPNKDRAARLNKIESEIALEATRKTPSAAGTQKARIDSLAAEKTQLLKSRDIDYNSAQQDWRAEQTRLQNEALAKKQAETSLFDMVPGTRAALTAVSPFASYFGGKYFGKRLSPWAAVPVGATTGALEGAASIGGPTEVDINSLPESSPTRQQAQASLSDPDYYKRMALAAGVSGAFGGLGAAKGYASTRPTRIPPPAPPPASSAFTGVPPAPPPPQKTRIVYTDPSDPKIKIGTFYANSGRWQGPNGHWMKKTDYPDPKKYKAGKPENYADGGAVDQFEESPYQLRKDLGYYDMLDATVPNEPFSGRFGEWEETNNRFKPAGSETPTLANQPMRPPVGNPPSQLVDPAERNIAMPPQTPNANPYAAMAQQQPPAMPEARSQQLADNPWMALLSAGLGTMASAGQRDARGLPMSPAAAIGHGGGQGIKMLQDQREAAMKQQQIAQAVKKLDADALRHQRAMDETERHNKINEARQKESLDFQKSRTGIGLFDEETTRMMAEQALTGDKSVFANLGRGVSGPQNIVQVRQEMNRIAKERGYKGEDIAALNANFAAQVAGARTAGIREANIATAVEEAKGTFPLALAASGNLSRTDYTPVNKLLAAVRSGTSTPEQAEFALAHQAVITAYSQAMSRTGVNTVHAQERAEKAFSDVQNHESYERSIKQLEREMAVALSAPEKARQMILDRITGKKHPEESIKDIPKKVEYTGRTATNKEGKKLRETKTGDWVE